MVSINKVMDLCYIVRCDDMYYDLYIDLNENGLYECFFFDQYFESSTINGLKKEVKKLITNNN